MATTPNTTTATGTGKREVTTTFRHAASKKNFAYRWHAPYGMNAVTAAEILTKSVNPDIVGDIAKALGVSKAEVTLSITKRTELREGTVTLASEKKAPRAKAPSAPAQTPQERVNAWALAHVQEHPNVTFARALKLGEAAIASEVKAAALADLDARISDARDALKALEQERATLAKAR